MNLFDFLDSHDLDIEIALDQEEKYKVYVIVPRLLTDRCLDVDCRGQDLFGALTMLCMNICKSKTLHIVTPSGDEINIQIPTSLTINDSFWRKGIIGMIELNNNKLKYIPSNGPV